MPRRSNPVVCEVTLLAVATDRGMTLLDRQGRAIGCTIKQSRLEGPINRRSAEPCLWRSAAQRMVGTALRRVESQQSCPWFKRANSLAKSFKLRGLEHCRPRSRQRFESFPTTTWTNAANRMWQQGNSAQRYHGRSGWTRWASTVSNNHNKRKGGKYARR